MSKKKKYFVDPIDGLPVEPVHDWVLEKHARLRRYIDASSGVRKRFVRDWNKRPAFVDLYCGPGRARVDETGEMIAGSALVAADEATRTCPFSEIIIADLDASFVSACATRLESAGHTNVRRFCGPADETAAEVVRSVQQQTFHVVFLDPFSLHALPFSVIETLAKLRRADLLVHFSVMDFRRNLEAMKGDDRLDLVMPNWQAACATKLGVEGLRQAVFTHWCGLITGLGYKECERIETVRGPNGAALYWLALFSRHPLGTKLWNAVGNLGEQGSLDLQ
jgi:three-Cys-motif partner protein